MRVNLKVLGLALVASLAMSAVAASAAQATGSFTADGYNAVAKGAKEGPTNYLEATTGEKVECATSTYQATMSGPSNTLTVTPHYSGCNGSRTVALNGCHFAFDTHGTSGGHTTGTADVICNPGKTIEVKGPFGICEVHIGPQTGLTGITFTNVAATGDVTVDVDITNQIHYTDTDTAFCPFSGNTTGTDGDFVSKVLMSGFQDNGANIAGPTGAGTTYNASTTPTDIFVN